MVLCVLKTWSANKIDIYIYIYVEPYPLQASLWTGLTVIWSWFTHCFVPQKFKSIASFFPTWTLPMHNLRQNINLASHNFWAPLNVASWGIITWIQFVLDVNKIPNIMVYVPFFFLLCHSFPHNRFNLDNLMMITSYVF